MKREIVGLNKTAFRVVTILFFAVVFLLLVNTNMRKGLSHDEHMYVAGGHLLASESLLPYRDYPYLQMPNLALVYGALFRGTDHLLLAARLLNTLFATLMLGAIFYYATSLLSNAGNAIRWSVGAGSVLLILFNPLFIYTSGLAWNHDLPVLLTLLAAILYSRTAHSRQSARVWLVGGLLVGLAVGTRLSFALTVIPFAVAILLLPETPPRRKLYLLGTFFAGAFLGLLPAISLAIDAPTTFAFDNWTYHQVNQAYWQQQGYDRAMDLESKLAYLKAVVMEPGSMALFATFLLFSVPAFISALRERQRLYSPIAFIALLAAVLLVSALTPTPTWYQYFYTLVPFLALGVVCAFASLYTSERWRRWGALALFGLAVVISGVYGLPAYLRLNSAWSPESWVPNEVHRAGMEIKQAVGDGKVATLTPLFPMEGGAKTYKELASGPFEWRVAPLLTDRQRRELNVLSSNNLEDFLNADPPQGILVGFESALEEPLVQYAMRHGYRPVKLSNGATLWLP